MPQAESNVEYLNSNKRNGHPGLMADGGTNSHPDCPRPYWELPGSGGFDLDEFEMLNIWTQPNLIRKCTSRVDGGTNLHPDCPRPYWGLLGSGGSPLVIWLTPCRSHSFQHWDQLLTVFNIGIKFSCDGRYWTDMDQQQRDFWPVLDRDLFLTDRDRIR